MRRFVLLAFTFACVGTTSTSGDVQPSAQTAAMPAPDTPAEAAPDASGPHVDKPPAAPSAQQLTIGPFTITPVYHSTILIEHQGTALWVDPWSKRDLEALPKADVVLITDVHFDHHDEDGIAMVAKDDTVFVAPKAVAVKREAAGATVDHVLANRESANIAGLEITAVPMYNIERGPKPGKLYHEPGRGNGYVLRSGKVRLYIAGDTECTPEMKAMRNIDAAFIPMNLPYTMPPEEAAACVAAFRPSVVVPYHHAGSDVGVFTRALDEVAGVKVKVLDFYAGGLPW